MEASSLLKSSAERGESKGLLSFRLQVLRSEPQACVILAIVGSKSQRLFVASTQCWTLPVSFSGPAEWQTVSNGLSLSSLRPRSVEVSGMCWRHVLAACVGGHVLGAFQILV